MSGEWDGGWNTKVDGLETELVGIEAQIQQLRGRQVEILTELDRLQVDMADGDRGMEDWTAVIEACRKHIAGFFKAAQQAQQAHSPKRQVNPLVFVARHVDADRIETSLKVTQAV